MACKISIYLYVFENEIMPFVIVFHSYDVIVFRKDTKKSLIGSMALRQILFVNVQR